MEQVQIDRILTDKASSKDTQRPQLEALLAFVREGDLVVIHNMDRLARNLDDLRKIVQDLTKRNVQIEFVKENLTFTGEDSPMANLMLSMVGAFAEFKRCLDSRTSARGNCIGQAAWRVLRTKEVISKCYKLLKRVKLCVTGHWTRYIPHIQLHILSSPYVKNTTN
ncbi:recombinase family protein [Paenibacillus kribbensis]